MRSLSTWIHCPTCKSPLVLHEISKFITVIRDHRHVLNVLRARLLITGYANLVRLELLVDREQRCVASVVWAPSLIWMPPNALLVSLDLLPNQ
jgi:hypothetical protein